MRRFLLMILALAALVVIAVGTIPFWLGPSLRTVGPRYGLNFKHYERLGYSRFALVGVTYRSPAVNADITRVELASPMAWLWQRTREQGADLRVERWAVKLSPEEKPPTDLAATSADAGWLNTRATARAAIDDVAARVRRAQVGPGTVTFPGGELNVAGLNWENRELTVMSATYQKFEVDATLAAPAAKDELTLTARGVSAPSQRRRRGRRRHCDGRGSRHV